jgi:hypothetical protein
MKHATLLECVVSTLFFPSKKASREIGTSSMTSKESHILLFGDHTERDIRLEELYEYSKQSKNMRNFLQDSFQSIQLVFLDLSEPERTKYEFSSFQGIAKSLATSPSPDVALRTVLLCVAQLGYLIAYE